MFRLEEYEEDEYEDDLEDQYDYSNLISNRDKVQINKERKQIRKQRILDDGFD